MHFFDKRLTLIILIFSLPLLFLPKINLLSLGDSETAGIRIDDLVLFCLAILFIWAHLLLERKLYKIELWVLLLTCFSIFSFATNRLFVAMDLVPVDAKIFYALRFFEYFLFFYIGAFTVQFFPGNQIVKVFFIWNFLLMLLQKIKLAGAVTIDGYSSNVSDRVQGIASFPSEMGLLLNLLFCYLAYDSQARSKIILLFPPFIRHVLSKLYLYVLFCLIGVFVVFTGNRISILALLICFLFKLKDELKLKAVTSFFVIILVTGLIVSGVVFVVSKTESLVYRSIDLFSTRNLTLITDVWERIDMDKDPIGNEAVPLQDYDISWWLRIHKWIFAFKMYITHPECYLQGIGPGFAWSALDGGLLRILVETGLIGCFLFWKIFSIIYKLNRQLKWMIIAFCINMIFFDAYLAYKTMSFLLFTAGHAFGLKQNQDLQQAIKKPFKRLNPPLKYV